MKLVNLISLDEKKKKKKKKKKKREILESCQS